MGVVFVEMFAGEMQLVWLTEQSFQIALEIGNY